MNVNVLRENDFKLDIKQKMLSQQKKRYSKNNLTESLQSFGILDSNFLIETKSQYSFAEIEEENFNFQIQNHCTINDYTNLNLQILFSQNLDSEIMCTKFNHKNNLIACGLSNGHMAIVDIHTAQIRYVLQTSPKKYCLTSLKWKVSQEDIITTVNAQGLLQSYNLNTNKQRYKFTKNSQLLCMDYNFSSDNIIIGDNEGRIILYNENSEQEKQVYNPASQFSKGHSNRIFSVKYMSSDHNMFLSGGWDSMVFLWDIRESKPVQFLNTGKINGDTIDQKGNKILIGSTENKKSVQIYDMKKMQLIQNVNEVIKIKDKNLSVYTSKFSPQKQDQTIFVGSSQPNCVRIFEPRNQNLGGYFHSWSIDNFENGIYSLDVSQDQSLIGIGCGDKNLKVIGVSNFD